MQNAEPLKFIADVHVGKLARLLRLLGFDTIYQNNFTNAELLALATAQQRILLSRNPLFAAENSSTALHILHEDAMQQLLQVVRHFGLQNSLHPFTRCLVCNGKLMMVEKEKIIDRLQENTAQFFHQFWQCQHCGRIYWKGSHYERMQQVINWLHNETT